MYDTMRTAAGAAQSLTSAAPASTGATSQLTASQPPSGSGIQALHWSLATPQQRVGLLRQHHALRLLRTRRGGFFKAIRKQNLQGAASTTASSSSAWDGRVRHFGLRPENALTRLMHRLHAQQGLPARVAQALHQAQVQGLASSAAGAASTSASHASSGAQGASATASAQDPQGARSPQEAQALAQVTQQFQARFAQSARDPAAFQALLKQAFGDKYDAAKAETIRQQSLAGDFSWMPKVKLADASQLRDVSGAQGEGVARGCYSAGEDTVYLNRDLLASDPAMAEKVLAEEVGHALDTRLNTSDSAGDEGDIFSRLVHGETISSSQLAEMKSDNDHGVIEINGKKTEVEYNVFKKFARAIKGAVKKVAKAIANGIKKGFDAFKNIAVGMLTMDFNRVQQGFSQAWEAVKDTANDIKDAVKEAAKEIRKIVKEAVIKLLQNKYFNIILQICSFIPIAPLQLAVRVIQMVKAAYMLYQGIKDKSWSMALSAVASLATQGSNFAQAAGFTNVASTLATVGSYAGTASQIYNAAASKNWVQAVSLGAQAFGAPAGVTQTLQTAAKIETVVHAVEDKNYGAALAGAADVAGVSQEAKGYVEDLKHAEAAYKAYRDKDYTGMASELGDAFHVGAETRDVIQRVKTVDHAVHAVEKGQYTQAFADLRQAGQGLGLDIDLSASGSAQGEKPDEDKTTFDHIKTAGRAALNGQWGTVIAETGQALGVEGRTKEVFDRAQAIDASVHLFEDGKYEQGAQQVGKALGLSSGQQETVQDLVHVKRADDARERGDNQKALDELGAAFHGTGGVQPWIDRAKQVDAGVHEFEAGRYEAGAAQVGQGLGLSANQQEVLVDATHLKRAEDAWRAGDHAGAFDQFATTFHGSGGTDVFAERGKQLDAGVQAFESGAREAGARQVGASLGLSAGQQETLGDIAHLKDAQAAYRRGDSKAGDAEIVQAFHGSSTVQGWVDDARELESSVRQAGRSLRSSATLAAKQVISDATSTVTATATAAVR